MVKDLTILQEESHTVEQYSSRSVCHLLVCLVYMLVGRTVGW